MSTPSEPQTERRPLPDGRVIVHAPVLGSTQDLARDLVLAGDTVVAAVTAGVQTAGRGRRGATWHAPAGACLLVTHILRGPDCTPDVSWRLAFAAGVAVAEAVEALGVPEARLKWPNDVRARGRKLAGILIEMAPGAPEPVALVGIGVNVNVREFPADLRHIVTSLVLETGREVAVMEVEEAVRAALDAVRRESASRGFASLLDRWLARDATAGQRYSASVDDHEARGTAEGIAPGGELLLRLDDGTLITTMAATSLPEG